MKYIMSEKERIAFFIYHIICFRVIPVIGLFCLFLFTFSVYFSNTMASILCLLVSLLPVTLLINIENDERINMRRQAAEEAWKRIREYAINKKSDVFITVYKSIERMKP